MPLPPLQSTPKQDGFFMPAEYSPIQRIWIVWPYRLDNWRDSAGPAQEAYLNVAMAISEFSHVTIIVDPKHVESCQHLVHQKLATAHQESSYDISIVTMPNDDAWVRDTGPSFLINKIGRPTELRACDWTFNAWGGDVDGLYSPWEDDDRLASNIANYLSIKRYRTDDFVLEGGGFHVDGEDTVLTTRMCLLSSGRNPHLTEQDVESRLKDYLNAEKVLWLDDGIDPQETNGHIDAVACFARPGEVICIYTDDETHPFYATAQKCYQQLLKMSDAKGRQLKVHKLCCTKEPVALPEDIIAPNTDGSQAKSRIKGELCIASYANFLICNDGIIVPQYDDENDKLALQQLRHIFPSHKVVGVQTREIVYGGGNIHCITQQQPAVN